MKKFKPIFAVFFVLLLSVQSIAPIYARSEKQINVMVDGLLQKTNPNPININGAVMMEAESLFTALGITKYTIDVKTGKVTFSYKNRGINVMEVDNKFPTVSGVSLELSVPPQRVEDKYIFLPVRFVVQRCGIAPKWDGDTNTVVIDTFSNDYSVLEYIQKNIDDEGTVNITLLDAVKNAMKNSNEIKTLDKAINDAQDMIDKYKPIFDRLRNYNLSDPFELVERERALRSYSDIVSKANVNKKLLEKGTELSIISISNSIEGAEYDIMLLEKKIALDEMNIKNMELKQQLGMETEANVKTAKDNLEQSKINLENLKINLSNYKMDLNKTVSHPLNEKLLITYSQNTDPIKIDDLDKYIQEKIDKSYNVELKDIEYRNAWLHKDTHYSVPQAIREREKNVNGVILKGESDSDVDAKYDIALAALDKEKEGMEYKIRKAYNSILLLNEQYNSKELDRIKAIDNYKTISVMYQVGNVTFYEVQMAELAILNAEIALKQNRLSYALLKYTFENPDFLK